MRSGCGRKARRSVATKVIAPIFTALLEPRFAITHHRFLRRHILGTLSEEFLPGDLIDPSAHKYESLFRKWDLRMVSDIFCRGQGWKSAGQPRGGV